MAKAIQIRMGGYGPVTTGFSKSLKFIGERLEKHFGDRVEVKYVWNIMDFGYRAEDILWLVEHGLLTLGYQSSSYRSEERRVGKECMSRWWQYHYKKNTVRQSKVR